MIFANSASECNDDNIWSIDHLNSVSSCPLQSANRLDILVSSVEITLAQNSVFAIVGPSLLKRFSSPSKILVWVSLSFLRCLKAVWFPWGFDAESTSE